MVAAAVLERKKASPLSSFVNNYIDEDGQQPPTQITTTQSCSGDELPPPEPQQQQLNIRRLAAPLSKEQLIELLETAAALSPAVHSLVQATALASPAARRIMVRNIHYNTTDAAFLAHFAQFGPLEDAAIVREKCGRSKGFGFVTFKNIQSMHKCLNSTLHLDGRKLFVKVAADPFSEFLSDGAPIQGRMTRRKIFIRNLPAHCSMEELRDAFSQYGEIEDCAIVTDGRGRSRGFAFITFSTQEGAVKASAEPQQTFAGRVIFVSIAKSCGSRQPLMAAGGGGVNGKVKQRPGAPPLFGIASSSSSSNRLRSNVLFDPWSENDALILDDFFVGAPTKQEEEARTQLSHAETLANYALYPYSAAAAAAAYDLITAAADSQP